MGATISCGGLGRSAGAPHVQSYILATDRVGMEVLRSTGTVFQCHKDLQDTILHGEIGASRAIMAAGYNIDSLMLRYQVSWHH